MTIGLSSSHGGHLTVLLQLEEAFSDRDAFLITNRNPRRPKQVSRVYFIPEIGTNPLKMILGTFLILGILVREKPSIFISTGAEIALPTLFLAKIVGATTVYVESIPRLRSLSTTGRLLLGWVDHFLVQSDELKNAYGDKVEYEGTLI